MAVVVVQAESGDHPFASDLETDQLASNLPFYLGGVDMSIPTVWNGYAGASQLYAHSWVNTQDIEEASYAYGADRYTVGLPAAPNSGVRVRVGNPNHNDIAIAAASFGYLPSDRVITIWSHTLREDPTDENTSRIAATPGDKITVGTLTYIIRSVKEAHWDTQYVCYCSLATDENPEATPAG